MSITIHIFAYLQMKVRRGTVTFLVQKLQFKRNFQSSATVPSLSQLCLQQLNIPASRTDVL